MVKSLLVMPPEYSGTYVPPEHIEEFEAFITRLDGAILGVKKPVKRDSGELLGFTELVLRTKYAIQQIPQETLLRDLTHWGDSGSNKRFWNVKTPSTWAAFMTTIADPGTRGFIAKTINMLYRGMRRDNLTMENLRELDWPNLPQYPNLGQRGRDFLSEVFAKEA